LAERFDREGIAMRLLLGIILGAVMTIAGAYCYDVLTGKAVTPSDTAAVSDNRPMVNWDVVGKNWQSLQTSLRGMADRVQEQWSKRSG
jgi:hypothetical protein